MTEIQKKLFALQDEKYRSFNTRLLPTVDKETIIGVRTPAMRKLAKELRNSPEAAELTAQLPHRYFEEYGLHALLIANIKDFDEAVRETERLLPYIDNWATCDSLKIKAFQKSPEHLLPYIDKWLNSKHTYTVRFAIGCLMNYFLDERFRPEYLQNTAAVSSDEYYVNMMIAWYFATALAKQYDAALPYLEQRKLSKWVHNKTIQKAVESYRVTDEHKAYLKSLKIK